MHIIENGVHVAHIIISIMVLPTADKTSIIIIIHVELL